MTGFEAEDVAEIYKERDRREAASAGVAPIVGTGEMVGPLAVRHWKAPFRYDAEGQMTWDANNARALDVRGWGRLTGQGMLGLSDSEAEKIIDDFGQSVVRILNAQWPNNIESNSHENLHHKNS